MENLLSKVYFKRLKDWTAIEEINNAVLSIWERIDNGKIIEKKNDFTAIKLTFGEEGNTNYINPVWILRLIELLKQKTENLFILETNTLYRERRSNAVGHLHVAHLHGYDIKTLGIPIIIGDGLKGQDSQTVPIKGIHFEKVKLAKAVCETNSIICLSHITGHCQTGFAGAIKNLGMGCSARAGKLLQHSKTLPEINIAVCVGCGACMDICPADAIGLKRKKAIIVKDRCLGCGECTVACSSGAIAIKYDENLAKLQEKMVEYALGVKDVVHSKIACINFLYRITMNCDCMANGEAPFLSDVGIIGGLDPVSIDKASLDILGIDNFKRLYPEIDPLIQIQYGEKIKLGSSKYEMVEI